MQRLAEPTGRPKLVDKPLLDPQAVAVGLATGRNDQSHHGPQTALKCRLWCGLFDGFATEYARVDPDIRNLQSIMGQADPGTTTIYTTRRAGRVRAGVSTPWRSGHGSVGMRAPAVALSEPLRGDQP
jgi:hypothetical protein